MSPGCSSQKAAFYLGKLLAKKEVLLSPSRHKDERDVKTVDITHSNAATSPSISFPRLFRFATRSELILDCIGLFAAACSGTAQPLMTLFFGNLIQSFIDFEIVALEANYGSALARAQIPMAAARFRQVAAKDTMYLVYMGIGLFCCTSISMGVWMYSGELNAKRLRENYLRAVLHQDIAFFDCVGAGEITTRIHNDTYLVQQGISQKVPLVTNKLFAFITGFALAYFRNWRLALAVSSILPVMVTMGAAMNIFTSKCTKLYLQHISRSVTMAVEAISTIRTAQAFGIQSSLADIYDTHIDRSKKIDTQSAVLQGIGGAVLFFVLYAAYGLVFSFGATLINEDHASVGSVVTVILAIFIGSSNFLFLAPELQIISHGCGAAANLFQVIDRVPDINSADPGGFKPEKVEGHITFENVNFSYPSRPSVPVIKDLSFTLLAGETTALVGISGAGKSTIVSLVERFYDPLSGVIKLDGVDIKNLNIKWLRSQIGLVSQEPTLFATTIQENVAQGLIGTEFEDAPEEKKIALVKDACIKANADHFIGDLPLGYNTMVGESGFLTSGGQKQRIAIARAIVGDPKILLLDEATSALDTQSEGIVQDALNRAAAGRTTVIIAHRLSTVKDADRIFVIGDGLVLEHGTHSQLLSNSNGPYSRLVTAQNLRKGSEVTTKKPENDVALSGETEDMQTAAEGTVCRNTTHTLAIVREHTKEYDHETEPEYNLFYMVKRIGGLNRAGWLNYGCGIIAALLNGMVYSAFTIVYSKGLGALSSVDPHQRRRDGDRVALWFFLIAITSIILSAVQNYMFAYNAAAITAKLRSMSFRAILKQDSEFFVEFFDRKSNTTGGLVSSLIGSPEGVKRMAGVSLGAILQSIATLVSATVLGLAFSWKLGLVALACLPVLLFTGYSGVRVVLWREARTRMAHESSAHIACETASAIRTVVSLTRENDYLRIYSQSLEASLQRAKRSALWSSMLFAASQATTFFVTALVFWYGSRLVSTFVISNPTFFIVLMSTTYGFSRASSTFAFAPSFSLLKSACSSFIQLVDAKPEINTDSSQGTSITEALRGQIQFQNVHFHYPRRPSVCVLRGLSFKAEPGTYIALVGASGSGKSTVIQLIERFYNPSAGHIYLDDEAISELSLQKYRQQIALVSQEPTLYSGTIRFNILLGAIKLQAEVTQEEIERVCRDANILDFINSLPNGFDTEVGNKGSQLSGGQKQRIAIARALIRNPKILLLDEATSALDSTSEQVVQDALDRAAQGRTTIAIAHRLSTIQNADCIYFIKKGMISESGTHDELLRKRGDYYDYVHLQVLSKN